MSFFFFFLAGSEVEKEKTVKWNFALVRVASLRNNSIKFAIFTCINSFLLYGLYRLQNYFTSWAFENNKPVRLSRHIPKHA